MSSSAPQLLRSVVLERVTEGVIQAIGAVLLIALASTKSQPLELQDRAGEALAACLILGVLLAAQRRRRFRTAEYLNAPVNLEPKQRTLKHSVAAVALIIGPLGGIALTSGNGAARFGALLLGAALALSVDALAYRRQESRNDVRAYRHSAFSLSAGSGTQLWLLRLPMKTLRLSRDRSTQTDR